MKLPVRGIVLLVLAGGLGSGDALAGKPPPWLADALARPLPPGSDEACAAVLHDEQRVELRPRERTRILTRFAIRVLAKDGADRAAAAVPYVRGESEVLEFRAWLMDTDGGLVQEWKRSEAHDVSAIESGVLYTDERLLLSADAQAKPGHTWACEWIAHADPQFAEWRWWFESDVPVALSRFQILAPKHFEFLVRVVNADSVHERREQGNWSWEMRDLPALPSEPLMPFRSNLEASVCVRLAATDARASAWGVSFADWSDAAGWLAGLTEAPGRSTAGIALRARQITTGASDTLDRVSRLARYVQNMNYVARDDRLGVGWGYRPHDADAVLAAGYGDCKDKANLLCALLRSQGVEAWLLAVNSHDRDRVDSAWVSLSQFNHCITAIRTTAADPGPRLDGGRLGPLIVFDPTDPLTTFGDLPLEQQGSLGLLVAPSGGGLTRLPVLPMAASRVTRWIRAELDSSGAMRGTLIESSVGQAARRQRGQRRTLGEQGYRRWIEDWLPAQGGPVNIITIATSDDTTGGAFHLRIEYDSPVFARSVDERLMTLRSELAYAPISSARFERRPRRTPVALRAECFAESVMVRLPAEVVLEQCPEPVRVQSDLGRFEADWREDRGVLFMTRHFEIRPVTAPPERWPDVRDIFAARHAAAQQGLILVRR